MTYNKLENKLKEEAEKQGYRVYRGGWPDLLLEKGDEILFVEVKGNYYSLQPHQKEVLKLLGKLGLSVRLSLDGTLDNLITLEEYEKREKKERRLPKEVINLDQFEKLSKKEEREKRRSLISKEDVKRFRERRMKPRVVKSGEEL